MIYFDHNATSPLLAAAGRVWRRATGEFVGNPSSPHRLGSRADAVLTRARERLAGILGCEPWDIIWTSGATESNNAVLHHAAQTGGGSREVWLSAIEHPSAMVAARHYSRRALRLIPCQRSGVVELDWLSRELKRRRPALVGVMAANNETGVLQPWQEVLGLCEGHGVPLFCDATQWVGRLPAQGLGACAFVSGSGHKFGGPRGVGFLKCPARGRVKPLLLGGQQEEGRRAGTENVPGVLAMMAALEARETAMAGKTGPSLAETQGGGRMAAGVEAQALAGSGSKAPRVMSATSAGGPSASWEGSREVMRRVRWRETFEQRMLAALSGAELVGGGQARLWNTVAALMPEVDCRQRWVVKLDKLGLAVSTGSACASGREEPSHVLAGMGYSPSEAGRMLRFSSGWETRPADWEKLFEALVVVQRERETRRG